MEYPLSRERDHKLWELDGQNVQLVTGMTYTALRQLATALGNDNVQYDEKTCQIKESMHAPHWFTVLDTKAQNLWDWRVANGMYADITEFWFPKRYCNGCGDEITGGRFCETCSGNMAFGTSFGAAGVW